MKKPVLPTVIASFLLGICVSTAVQAQQMYKWTDKDGVVHFSETPPTGQQAEASDIPAGPPLMGQEPVSSPSMAGQPSAAQQRRDEIAQNRDRAETEAALRDAQCAAKRAEVARLEPNRRVFYTDESGETVRMDDQVRVDKVAAAKRYIEQNCS
jgi:hypothetical protein